jgi:hypothetical protein
VKASLILALMLVLPLCIERDNDLVETKVDPRIELLYAVMRFSEYKDYENEEIKLCNQIEYNYTYKNEFDRYFSEYREHEAVGALNELKEAGVSYYDLFHCMVSLSDPPELEHKVGQWELESAVWGSWPEKMKPALWKRWDSFVAAMRDYAKVSDFMSFYTSHMNFYDEVVKRAGIKACRSEIENYFGRKAKSYEIILMPLAWNFGYSAMFGEGEDTQLIALIGPFGVENDLPVFRGVELTAYHEFSHRFVKPVVKKYYNETEEYEALYGPVKDMLTIKDSYSPWSLHAEETIVRAISLRFMGDKEFVRERLNEYESMGFIYIRDIYDLLGEYEGNRDKYPDFESFYPEILEWMGAMAESPSG